MADKYNSKIAGFIGWLNGAEYGYAVTISSTCTLYSVGIERVNPKWRIHEDRHKWQIIQAGSWWQFMFLYFKANVTAGYYANPYEIDARRAANGQV